MSSFHHSICLTCASSRVDQEACSVQCGTSLARRDFDNWSYRSPEDKDDDECHDWLGRSTEYSEYSAYINCWGDGGDEILSGYELPEWRTSDNLFDPLENYGLSSDRDSADEEEEFFRRDLPYAIQTSLTWDDSDSSSEASPLSPSSDDLEDRPPLWASRSRSPSPESDEADDELPTDRERPCKPALSIDVAVVSPSIDSPTSTDSVARYTCPLCIEPQMNLSSIRCGHVFCTECIYRAITAKGRCPLCRDTAHARDVRRIFLA